MRALLASALAVLAASAVPAAPAGVRVGGWARPTIAGQSAGAAYLHIRNTGPAGDRLLAVSSPAAASAAVHRSSIVGGVSRMRPAGPIAIAPGGTLAMGPNGLHVMLVGLRRPLRPGSRLPLTLKFERAGVQRTTIPIQMSAPDAGHAHH